MSKPSERQPKRRTRVRRLPKRALYERVAIESILDEGFLCHLGFVDDGYPVVIPTLYARIGGHVYLHGSAASRALRRSLDESAVCLTVTLVDGLVLARAAFHHSMNYRSVVLFGRAEPVDGDDERLLALEKFVDKLIPGRWDEVRPPSRQELNATSILRIPIDEASAKVREGPPADDADDYALEVWAGVIPLELRRLAPRPDPKLGPEVEPPSYLAGALPGRKDGKGESL
jgi:nitroimidazol reductase NimA-like FMN-containing flavoprotein (pyridoxamine 5'-phosphate oxidase superfamily)